MKDEKAKYLIIEAKDIKKQLYNMKRESGFVIKCIDPLLYNTSQALYAKQMYKSNRSSSFEIISVSLNCSSLILV